MSMICRLQQLDHGVETQQSNSSPCGSYVPYRHFSASRLYYFVLPVALLCGVQWSSIASAWLPQPYHRFPSPWTKGRRTKLQIFDTIITTPTTTAIVTLQDTLSRDEATTETVSSSSSPARTIREMALFLSLSLTQSLMHMEPPDTMASPRKEKTSDRVVPPVTARSETGGAAEDMDDFLNDLMENVETVPTTTSTTTTTSIMPPPSSRQPRPLSITEEPVPTTPTITGPLTTDETSLEEETFVSLHQKEGDRVIATHDTFASSWNRSSASVSTVAAADDAIPTIGPATTDLNGTSLTVTDATVPQSTMSNSMASTTPEASSGSGISKLIIPTDAGDALDDTATASLPWITPVVPPAISKAFGRPLPVSREAVPPLQPNLNRTSAASRAAANVTMDNEPFGE